MYADGGGLYLQVTGAGAKSWIFRFTLRGHAREMGLGALHTISLTEARVRAAECRRLCHDGVDPIEVRRAKRKQASLEAARSKTFRQCAAAYVEAYRAAWRSSAHTAQWIASLEMYAGPVFGDISVQLVDVALVTKALDSIWITKPTTAGRVRGRIEAVLDWATVRGYRTGENPARWKGHLQKLLPSQAQVRRVRHFAALPYVEVPSFMRRLSEQIGVGVPALRFAVFTAARTGEVIRARWGEFDLGPVRA